MKEPIQIDVDLIDEDPSSLDAVVSIDIDPISVAIETDSSDISTKMESFDNDYEALIHKPKVEGVTLIGDKSLEELNVSLPRLGATIASNMQIDELFD